MYMNKYVRQIFFACLLIGFFLISCEPTGNVISVEKNDLFDMEYGNFEENINLFSLSSPGPVSTKIEMYDGFFYIANGESKKVMEMNSYGDLISVYYNAETNPTPSFVTSNSSKINQQNEESIHTAVEYPFNELGDIAVDERKYLYVVDRLPIERQEVDENSRVVLSQVVLRFDSNGTFIDYIGQQGPGGVPFPYIKNIYTTSKNELVVVCQTNTGMTVFWFNETGYLLYTVPFEIESLPNPMQDTTELEMFVSLEKIVPSFTEHKLFVKLDYYVTTVDTATNVQSGIDYMATLLYPLELDVGVYGHPLNIPAYDQTVTDGFSKLVYPMSYEFLGVTESGWLFFMIAEEEVYSIQMIQESGQKIIKRHLNIDHSSYLYHAFDFSSDGILSGLFAQEDKAVMSWWRTDTLIDSIING